MKLKRVYLCALIGACCTNWKLRTPLYARTSWEVKIQRSRIGKPFPPPYQGRITSPFCNWDDWIWESCRGQDVRLLARLLLLRVQCSASARYETRSASTPSLSKVCMTRGFGSDTRSQPRNTDWTTLPSPLLPLPVTPFLHRVLQLCIPFSAVMWDSSSCTVLKAPSIWDMI